MINKNGVLALGILGYLNKHHVGNRLGFESINKDQTRMTKILKKLKDARFIKLVDENNRKSGYMIVKGVENLKVLAVINAVDGKSLLGIPSLDNIARNYFHRTKVHKL